MPSKPAKKKAKENKSGWTCPECMGHDTPITPTIIKTSNIVDGRLRMSEMAVRFVIGCNACSHTLAVLDESQVRILPL